MGGQIQGRVSRLLLNLAGEHAKKVTLTRLQSSSRGSASLLFARHLLFSNHLKRPAGQIRRDAKNPKRTSPTFSRRARH